MALTAEQLKKLVVIKEINERMNDRYLEIFRKNKADERVAKCLHRKGQADVAKGGGLGFLTGLVTKFKKAHKPKNEATMQAANKYRDAFIQFGGTINDTNNQLEQIKVLVDKYPSLDGTIKTLLNNQVLSDNKLREADSAYQKAKTAELEIYDEFMKYLNSKDAKKEGDAKEYKEWKKQIEETIKELSKK